MADLSIRATGALRARCAPVAAKSYATAVAASAAGAVSTRVAEQSTGAARAAVTAVAAVAAVASVASVAAVAAVASDTDTGVGKGPTVSAALTTSTAVTARSAGAPVAG